MIITLAQFDNVTIRLMKSTLHPETSYDFGVHHINVLKYFGVTGLTSVDKKWRRNPETNVFIVETRDTNELIAGIRIDVHRPDFPIPLEDALGNTVPEVGRRVNKWAADGGVGEVAGLWVERKHAKLGLPIHLLRATVAIAPLTGTKNMVGFANKYSRKTLEAVGFRKQSDFENDGNFFYPDPRYLTIIMHVDCTQLDYIEREDFLAIQQMRHTYEQEVKMHKLIYSELY
ncbi:MAG TPA: hypothetical protein DCE41_07805 [Cytophagales bacterium]|nr:hypothetical protein [Cytophagales bacterium]HAP64239.1 hypothetical protein [Cytophagales bacterium]